MSSPEHAPSAEHGPEILRPDGEVRLLFVCDHASNHIPEDYARLGLDPATLERHVAWDIGAADVVRALSAAFGAPAVLTRFSRLLIDPNRGEDDPTLVMKLSDGAIVPGNRHADAAEVESRLARFYRPYDRAVRAAIDRALGEGVLPVIVSIHSFTPWWRGRQRPWHYGILWHEDRRLAGPMLDRLRREPMLVVGENEPYAGQYEGDSMDRHALKRSLPHLLVEIRQDLIGNPDDAARVAHLLERALKDVFAQTGLGPQAG